MCAGIGLYSTVKGLEYQWIIIPVTDHIGNDAAVVKVQNCTEIDLVYCHALIPLEFCHISEPLLIGHVRMKVPVQQILSYKLRILRPSGAAMAAILDSGLNAFSTANSENTLIVHMNMVVVPKIVIDAAIALVRAFHVDLLNFLCNLLVFPCPGTLFSGCPTMICRPGYMQKFTGFVNGISTLSVILLYCSIYVSLSYLSKASLLTISSNFFSKWFSISAR